MNSESVIQKFMQWVETVFTESYKLEVRDYLNESSDYADLENRIKLLKVRGLF